MKRLMMAIALTLVAAQAQATWISCDADTTNNVTPNVGCVLNDTPFTQDYLNTNPMTVNADGGAFGFTDWVFLKKDDPAVLGTWDFGALYPNMMLVYKYGREPFNAYLVNQVSGAWSQEFVKDISHVSYYVRDVPVSEPATLGLLFTGLFGLALRRKTA